MVISAEAVLEAALTAPETLPATLEAAGALPPDVAVEVARRGFTALDANDLPRAQAAFSAAALMFSTLEDWPRATECGIHHAEICKVLAITEAEHSLARDRALAMQGLARRLRLPALVLGASVVVRTVPTSRRRPRKRTTTRTPTVAGCSSRSTTALRHSR